MDGDKPADFTVKGVTEFLEGVDKYTGVVRAMARNEAADSTSSSTHRGQKNRLHGLEFVSQIRD